MVDQQLVTSLDIVAKIWLEDSLDYISQSQ